MGADQERAFQKLKECLISTRVLRPPIKGEPLYLYTTFTSLAVGALLAQDLRNDQLCPIHYISRGFRDAEFRYSKAEQACLALIYATQKLRSYLLAHETIVVATANPIAYLSTKPVLSGRTARWLLTLSEFELKYQRPRGVRGQAFADLLAAFPGTDMMGISEETPGEVAEVEEEERWAIFFDESSYGSHGGAGIVFETPKRDLLSFAFKLYFECSNNVAEYEALILGRRMAEELNLGAIDIKGDSKLVTNQVSGEFHVKEAHLAPYRAEVQELIAKIGSTVIQHTAKTTNRHGDALATLATKM
ncbi:uncharacterized protein LOC113294894 [Papaver somniferum]|uniref:uncharacterized protein LOC113294894 n=1 Tax=Papaver somniferum TaxID=3469 RepID=UPI000E6F660D|nr:uncharacterized protein LOC113294894 [Papaver somniferum]